MKRRLPPHKPIPEGKCYWPGTVAPGLDPIVEADFLHDQCERNMRHVKVSEDWRTDPTYNMRRKGRVHR